MKKQLFFIIISLFAISNLQAQKLGSVSFEQDGNNVKIHYQMSGIQEGQLFDVKILCSENGGGTFGITPKTISGAVGQGVELQNDKNTALWRVKSDRNTLDGYNFVFKVTVSKNIAPQMVFVKGGTFKMGSEDGPDNEKPIHDVTVSDFYMGKYEVTIEQYMQFVDETNSNYPEWLEKGNSYNINENGQNKDFYKNFVDDYTKPIVGVSWNNATAYCKWLNKKTGEIYSLPTEAQWEYAAGGGSTHNKWAGTNKENELKNYAWYSSNSNSTTHKVGTKKPNELGIYDMSGNVWEWCEDKWHDNYKNAPKDGSAWEFGNSSYRVYRGGSWKDNSYGCRVAYRPFDPARRHSILGFRLARRP